MNKKIICFVLFISILSNLIEAESWTDKIGHTFYNITGRVSDYTRRTATSIKEKIYSASDYFHIHKSTTHEEGFSKEEENLLKELNERARSYIPASCTETTTAANAPTAYDPTPSLSTPQLIAYYGYPAESHTIVTDDGYILTVHRIPYSKKSPDKSTSYKTVLLHHEMLASSADWVIPGPGKSLAFLLSDAGYDVWMANARGNTYSKAHVSKNVDGADFWNFTFHEVSQYDLPAVIDYMTKRKPEAKINYIGHSMGSTVLFALLSTKERYNEVLNAGFALAPVGYMSDVKSPLKYIAPFSKHLRFLMHIFGANQFLPRNWVVTWLSKVMCDMNKLENIICENVVFALCGFDSSQFNQSLLPAILGHTPAGASTKTLVHYAQEIQTGKFQLFDYGQKGNMEEYGSENPPEYPVEKITLPMAFISAKNDWLSGQKDVTKLYSVLATPIEHYVVPLESFNHIDFLWAKDAPQLVYDKLLRLMEMQYNTVHDSSVNSTTASSYTVNVQPLSKTIL